MSCQSNRGNLWEEKTRGKAKRWGVWRKRRRGPASASDQSLYKCKWNSWDSARSPPLRTRPRAFTAEFVPSQCKVVYQVAGDSSDWPSIACFTEKLMGYQVSKKIWCTLRILHIFWQEDRNRICLCTSAEVVVLILNRHEPQQFQVK